jgi:hypothetical protein
MRILALAAFAVLVAVAPASADVHTNPAAKISVDVPKPWKLAGGGNAMVASDPKEEAAVSMVVTDTDDPKKALELLDKQMGSQVKDSKLEQPTKIDVNGMQAIMIKGTATMNGKKVGLMILAVMTPINKIMDVMAVVEDAKFEAHKKEVTGILMSIKPAK